MNFGKRFTPSMVCQEGTAREWYDTYVRENIRKNLTTLFEDHRVRDWPNDFGHREALLGLIVGECLDTNGNVGHRDLWIGLVGGGHALDRTISKLQIGLYDSPSGNTWIEPNTELDIITFDWTKEYEHD